ncbi:orexin receptor type 2-like [Gigantopelta aegis]|uniref:orexin receptor type 2-like n=1 Tax=Gigantopelta aegis TaxID=1735272 RepID=UPI001B8874E4|nr:orexin receptor type 2-like [Gigantopelta aegis]
MNETYRNSESASINTSGFEDIPTPDENPRLINGIVLVFVALVGITGNSLVLYVQHFKCKRTTFSLFVKWLACLDLFNCLTTIPLDITIKTVPDLISINMVAACKISHYSAYATSMSSGMILFFIAVQRYKKVCRPFKDAINIGTARILCLVAIAVGAGISSLTIFVSGPEAVEVVHGNGTFRTIVCRADEKTKGSPMAVAFTVILYAAFSAVLLSVVVLYCQLRSRLLLQVKIRQDYQEVAAKTCGQPTSPMCDHVTKIFFIVTLVFIFSYIPHLIEYAVFVGTKHTRSVYGTTERILLDFAYNSPYINNIANPIIYSFLSTEFKENCKELFSFRKTNI